jgi:hypothetical protein
MPLSTDTQLLVTLDGRRVLAADGSLLAQLADDERWYTADGLPCRGLTVPAAKAAPQVDPAERSAAQRAGDRAWMGSAMKTIAELAATLPSLTSDDIWAAVEQPPREPRMIGNALRRAQSAGLIEPTDEHRRSQRQLNHTRPVLVWRSLDARQQHLC